MNTYTVEMVRALKGAPLSILVALALAGRTVSNEWLVANTGYTDKTVRMALIYLKEHSYVIHALGGWRLAGDERQLPFLLPAQDDVTSSSRNYSDSSGGSGLSTLIQDLNIKTTTTTVQAEILPLHDISRAAQALLSIGGVSMSVAESAILRALEHGIAPDEIERRIAACAAYIISKNGSNLKFPGSWAAGLIGAGYEPPLPAGEVEQDETKALSRFDGYQTYTQDK